MATKLNSLRDLFIHQLKDIYSAEEQIIKALPKMIKEASHKSLQAALEDHLEETKRQKEHLDEVGKILNEDLSGEKCKAIEGLIKEAEDMLKHKADDDVRDAGIIADAQRVEHYEIAVYGTLCHFAKRLGETEAHRILDQILQQEKNADSKLTQVAIAEVNKSAEQ